MMLKLFVPISSTKPIIDILEATESYYWVDMSIPDRMRHSVIVATLQVWNTRWLHRG